MRKIEGKENFYFKSFLLRLNGFRPTDMVNFDDVVAAAEDYMPSM